MYFLYNLDSLDSLKGFSYNKVYGELVILLYGQLLENPSNHPDHPGSNLICMLFLTESNSFVEVALVVGIFLKSFSHLSAK